MVAWNKCTKPKKKGGLVVVNLRAQNTALLMKNLDKFYNQRLNIPWVKLVWNTYYPNGEVPHAEKEMGSFWWKDLLRLVDLFRGIAQCSVGSG